MISKIKTKLNLFLENFQEILKIYKLIKCKMNKNRKKIKINNKHNNNKIQTKIKNKKIYLN